MTMMRSAVRAAVAVRSTTALQRRITVASLLPSLWNQTHTGVRRIGWDYGVRVENASLLRRSISTHPTVSVVCHTNGSTRSSTTPPIPSKGAMALYSTEKDRNNDSYPDDDNDDDEEAFSSSFLEDGSWEARQYRALQQRLQGALQMYEDLKERAVVDQDLDQAMIHTLFEVGDLQWELGDIDDAHAIQQDLLKRLLSLHQPPPPPPPQETNHEDRDTTIRMVDHEDVAKVLHRIGILYGRTNDWEEGHRWLQQSLEMKQRLFPGAFHTELGRTLNALGMLKVMEGDAALSLEYDTIGSNTRPWAEAMRLFDEAERHYKHHLQDDNDDDDDDDNDNDEYHHPDLVKVLDNQASLFRKHGQNVEALAKYRELLDKLEGGSSVEEEALLEARMNVADCLAATGELDEAISHYKQLLEHISNTNDTNNNNGGSRDDNDDGMAMECALRHNLGAIYAKQSHMDKALEQYSLGLKLKRLLGGDFHPEVASTLSGMAAVHATMGNPDRALAFFKEALLIHRSNHPTNLDHPDIQHTLRNIVLLEKAQRSNTDLQQKQRNNEPGTFI